jgi:hypothetical protein
MTSQTEVLVLTLTTNNPAGPCGTVSDQITVTIHPAATVDAGSDQTVCILSNVSLSGSFGGGATSVTWSTSGDGNFANANNPTTTYNPGPNDQLNGSVVLTLTTNNPPGPCPAESDAMTVTLSTTINYYVDNDNDGYGTGPAIPACIQPPGTSTVKW